MSTEKRVYRLEANGPENTGLVEMTCEPEDFSSDLPTQTLHVYYDDKEIGLSVGVWTTTPMQEVSGPYPGDEFIWLLEGGFKMVDAENQTLSSYKQGDCVFFRNAAPVSWVQEEPLRKFYITYLNPQHAMASNVSAKGAVQSIDPTISSSDMDVMDTTEPFLINGPMPTQRDYNYFTNDTEDMFVGMWDSTPFESEMEPFPCHEFVRLLEGEITITEANGTAHTFNKDDVFFIPKGTVCSWKTVGYIKKFYAMVS